MANSTQLAGHVEIGDHVVVGGLTAVTQHCRVGAHCFIGGSSIIRKDLPPFLSGKGNEFEVQGVNSVGLSRRGYSPDAVLRIKRMYKIFYLQGLTTSQAIEKVSTEIGDFPERSFFLGFIGKSQTGITR